MKKITTFAFAALAASVQAVTVDQVIVRQQWPWSTDIKVEYRLSDVTNPVDLTVRAFNDTTEFDVDKVRSAITGPLYGITGVLGTLTIDPLKAFGEDLHTIDKLKIKIELTDSAANINEVLYKILDIDATPVTITDVTRADFYNGKYGTFETNYTVFSSFSTTQWQKDHEWPPVTYKSSLSDVLVWTGVTNGDLYRTSKIVLRKIPAAGQSFNMCRRNSSTGEVVTNVPCSFTKDFWIGVFPITQYQLHKYMPNYDCWMSNRTYAAHALRAADGIRYDQIRGTDKSANDWPYGNHSNVASGSFFKGIQTAFGNTRLDLPTEAQWEFAARAGCDDIYPHGGYVDYRYFWVYHGGLFMKTADIKHDQVDRDSDDNTYGAYPPGYFAPNAYGLYDVMGNVRQICLDRAIKVNGVYPDRGGVDPRGSYCTSSGNMCRMVRGGSYSTHLFDLGEYYGEVEWYRTAGNGIRLCLHEED